MSRNKPIKSKGQSASPKVRRFIEHIAKHGNATDAIRHAGYQTKDAENMGRQYRFRYRQQINDALTERIENRQAVSLTNIETIADAEETPAGVRLKANQDILDRGNLLRGERAPTDKPEQSTDELIAALEQAAGAEATAMVLRKQGIPIPDYITAKLAGPSTRAATIPVAGEADGQGEADALPN